MSRSLRLICFFAITACAESNYPAGAIGSLKAGEQRVLPLLAETSAALAVVCESDVRDWAAMFLEQNASGDGVTVSLPDRLDKHGKVVSRTPRSSAWRVVMIARTAKGLVGNDLVPTLATPSVIGDTNWVKPGASEWDAWWTGINPSDPQGYTGVLAHGTTESHKEFITFAAEMSWPYQLMDRNAANIGGSGVNTNSGANNGAAGAQRVSQVQPSGNDLVVSFAAVADKACSVEQSDTLQSGSWMTVQYDIAGSDATITITDPGAACSPGAFYHIVLKP